MATDCKRLSPNARVIFKKLKKYYPADPWEKPRWIAQGKVYDNGWLDLRRSADRQKLIEKLKNSIGGWVELTAMAYHRKHGSLNGFAQCHFLQSIQSTVEELLLLNNLDFQIETMDLVEH